MADPAQPIDLAPFCARPQNDSRSYLWRPFALEGGTAASNWHLLVWVSEDRGAEPLSSESAAKIAGVAAKAKARALLADGWQPVSGVALSDKRCPRCNGHGALSFVKCDDCDGEGNFWHGRHEYECQNCEGRGELLQPGRKQFDYEGERVCEHCCGTRLRPNMPSGIGCDRQTVQSVYIALLQQLPNAEIAHAQDEKVFYVRFDGGVAAVRALQAEPLPARWC